MTLHLAGVGADRDTKEVRVVFVKYDPVAEKAKGNQWFEKLLGSSAAKPTVTTGSFGSIVAIGVAAGSRTRNWDSTGVQRRRIISPLARGNFSG